MHDETSDDEPTRPSWRPLADWRNDLAKVLSETQLATSHAWEALREHVPTGSARAPLIEMLDASRAHALAALGADDAAVALNSAEFARDLAATALDRARSYEPT